MNNKATEGDSMYNIDTYSDDELFSILDLNQPTDRELEARILFLIHKYENMQNSSGKQWVDFFNKIYMHFFDIEEEEEDIETELEVEGFDTISPDQVDISTNKIPISSNIDKGQITMKPTSDTYTTNDVTFTKTLGYAKDQLNPLLQQTIKRIISIDSQYRDDKQSLSTDFTFNLSDPLKDVVSLKLYSVQIPYTWYTISKSFGSNFFIIKGNVPGIDNGNHDLKVDISAGNYGPNELANAINSSIKSLASKNKDINFGATEISYNSFTSLMTTTIDITNRYSENGYTLNFQNWTSPLGPRFQSIPGYLGFNNISYNPFLIRSASILPLTINGLTDDNTRKYILTSSNNYFTVIKYIGPQNISLKTSPQIDYSSSNNRIDFSFNIQLATPVNSYTSRSILVADLITQLKNCPYITDDSEIKRVDITNNLLAGNGYSYFEIIVKPNRQTTNNINNSKMAIVFPYESISNQNPIWTGPGSCFCFTKNINELNTIVSETSPVQLQTGVYKIDSSPYIYLKCINSQFNLSGSDIKTTGASSGPIIKNGNSLYPGFSNNLSVDSNNNPIIYNDVCNNDFIIPIQNSNTLGYNITDYINTINNSISNYSKNNNISINTTYSNAGIDENNKFSLTLDINKRFDQSYYILDLTDSYLYKQMNFPIITNLSNSNVVTANFNISNSYTIGSTGIIATIKPSNLNYGNRHQQPYVITIPGLTTYQTYQDLQTAINNAFATFQDPYDKTFVLSGTNIKITPISNSSNLLNCTLTVIVQKTLTEKDYSIQFIDPSLVTIDTATKLIYDSSAFFIKPTTDISYVYTNINTAYRDLSNNYQLTNYTKIPETNIINISTPYYTQLSDAYTNISPSYIKKILDIDVFILNGTNAYSTTYTNGPNPIIQRSTYDIYLMTDSSRNYYLNNSNYSINNTGMSNTNLQSIYINSNDILGSQQPFIKNTIYNFITTGNIYVINSSNTTTTSSNLSDLYILDSPQNYYKNNGNYYVDNILDVSRNIGQTVYYIDNKDVNNNQLFDSNNNPQTSVYKYTSSIKDIYNVNSSRRALDVPNIYIITDPLNYKKINGSYFIDPSSCDPSVINPYSTSSVFFIANSDASLNDASCFTNPPTNPHVFRINVSGAYLINNVIKPRVDYTSSSWYKSLYIDTNMISTPYELSNTYTSNNITGLHSAFTKGTTPILQNTITLTSNNNIITLVPHEDGVYTSTDVNNITIKLAEGTYTRDKLISLINNTIPLDASGTNISVSSDPITNLEYTKIIININKIYSAADYRISYYDPYSFVKCYVGVTSVRNTTWDTTLGWILGYRAFTIYTLSEHGQKNTPISLLGDTGVSTNLFNYFMICLDDYNQNHLNDGLVTITPKDVDISLPSYASKAQFQCDPVTGQKIYNTLLDSTSEFSKLTQNQIYSLTQIANSKANGTVKATTSGSITNSTNYGLGPFVQDVFAIIPMKLSGLQNGQSFVEFGGTLQNQDRIYFGPVNIHRMSIKLISDKGDVIDLNGANWSVCLVCEQLYKQNQTKKDGK